MTPQQRDWGWCWSMMRVSSTCATASADDVWCDACTLCWGGLATLRGTSTKTTAVYTPFLFEMKNNSYNLFKLCFYYFHLEAKYSSQIEEDESDDERRWRWQATASQQQHNMMKQSFYFAFRQKRGDLTKNKPNWAFLGLRWDNALAKPKQNIIIKSLWRYISLNSTFCTYTFFIT